MVIVVDLTSLSYHLSGVERYAMCLTEEILKTDKKNEYVLLFRNNIDDTFLKYIDNYRIKATILHGDNKLIFYQIILPIKLYRINADKYLFFAFLNPILFYNKGIIAAIHDMVMWDYAETLTLVKKIYARLSCRVSCRTAERLITVSNFSKKRICTILKIPEKKVSVVPSALTDSITKAIGTNYLDVKEKYGLPEKYIMTLSTMEPRKNLRLLLDVFTSIKDNIDYDLVLVGRRGWMIDELLDKYHLQDRIHITGFVDDCEVAEVYKHAECFVFPSIYEGFGLPPLEALAMGTPVISSDAASMPEVLMNQATYFNNNDFESLKNLLLNLDKLLPNMKRTLNTKQLELYNFAESAKAMINILNDNDID